MDECSWEIHLPMSISGGPHIYLELGDQVDRTHVIDLVAKAYQLILPESTDDVSKIISEGLKSICIKKGDDEKVSCSFR